MFNIEYTYQIKTKMTQMLQDFSRQVSQLAFAVFRQVTRRNSGRKNECGQLKERTQGGGLYGMRRLTGDGGSPGRAHSGQRGRGEGTDTKYCSRAQPGLPQALAKIKKFSVGQARSPEIPDHFGKKLKNKVRQDIGGLNLGAGSADRGACRIKSEQF